MDTWPPAHDDAMTRGWHGLRGHHTMVTHSDLVLVILSVILAGSGSYRNNNNVIVVHSKVERMKGKAAAAIFAFRCRIKNKFCKFNYLNSTVIRATATLILQNSSGELRTVRITLRPCKAVQTLSLDFLPKHKILNVYSCRCVSLNLRFTRL